MIPPEHLVIEAKPFCFDAFAERFGGHRLLAVFRYLLLMKNKKLINEKVEVPSIADDPTGISMVASTFEGKSKPFFEHEGGSEAFNDDEREFLDSIVLEAKQGKMVQKEQQKLKPNNAAAFLPLNALGSENGVLAAEDRD